MEELAVETLEKQGREEPEKDQPFGPIQLQKLYCRPTPRDPARAKAGSSTVD